MSSLFHDDETVASPEKVPVEVVRLLEGYGYRSEVVKRWSVEKAYTTLNARRREEGIALKRAQQTAREQDGPGTRGQPSLVERQQAAATVEQSLALGADELCQTLGYTLHALTDDELSRLGGHLVRLLRGDA